MSHGTAHYVQHIPLAIELWLYLIKGAHLKRMASQPSGSGAAGATGNMQWRLLNLYLYWVNVVGKRFLITVKFCLARKLLSICYYLQKSSSL